MVLKARGLTTGLAAIAILAGAACHREALRTGDLVEIQESGELRVIVRPGFRGSSPGSAGGTDERSLLENLAARLRVRLVWVQARGHDEILPALALGRADLAVSRFSPAQVRAAGMSPTVALDWVEDLVIASADSNLEELNDLAAATLRLHRSGAGRFALVGQSLAPGRVWFTPVRDDLSIEAVVEAVGAGRFASTVADSAIVESLDRGDGRLRVIGPVAERRPLVWAVRSENPRLLVAVNDELFAEQVLARATRSAACRDLPQILEHRALRLITRNSPTTCIVERGGLEGFEYDLALTFARQLGLRLELVIPPPGADPIRWLELGHGDLAALHEPVEPGIEGRFLLTHPYRLVDLVTIVSSREAPPAAVVDLAGLRVAASRAVARTLSMLPLDPPPEWVGAEGGGDALSAMVAVQSGEAQAAVVDSDLARLELPNRPALQEGPLALEACRLVWIVNSSSPELRSSANAFLRASRRSGLVRLLVRSELGTQKAWAPRHLATVPKGALTPYDDLLRTAGHELGLDWRLLASLMYEESRFDREAVGPGGSAGLFQFMPFTWRELGVTDPHDPVQAVAAGAVYLHRLIEGFPDVPFADRVPMGVASYNVGPRHVFDARKLAREMDRDPDRWAGNVETAMVLLDNPDVARRFPAGVCRCRRAAAYTRRILRRYHAYAEQFPSFDTAGTPASR